MSRVDGGDDLRGHDPVEGHLSSLAVGSANHRVRGRDFDQLADDVVVWRLAGPAAVAYAPPDDPPSPAAWAAY